MVQSTTINNLYKKYGTDRAIAQVAGEYTTTEGKRVVEFDLDLTTLNTSTAVILSDTTFIPTGIRIEQVDVITKTAATSSGSGTLSIGLIKADRTTAVDATGFVSGMAKGVIDTAGKKVALTVGVTAVGTSVGSTLSFTGGGGYLTAILGTAVYQTGVVRVRIYYFKP